MSKLSIALAYLIALVTIALHVFNKISDTEGTYYLAVAIWLYVTNLELTKKENERRTTHRL